MIDNFFKYDLVENCMFKVLTHFMPNLDKLNTPDLNMRCPKEAGKLMLIKKDNKGGHFMCLRCFNVWIKPHIGAWYRKKDVDKRVETNYGHKRAATAGGFN